MKKRNHIKILLVVLLFVAAGIVYSCSQRQPEPAPEIETEQESEICAEESETSSVSEILICVHVCGAVKCPGVYYLKDGLRVCDAVECAGGLCEDAAADYVNLAGYISDGEQIFIPDKEEAKELKSPAQGEAADGLININTAGLEELKTLPGVGDIKAKAIISYREKVAAFEKPEDIKNVAGIKDSMYEDIKSLIKV